MSAHTSSFLRPLTRVVLAWAFVARLAGDALGAEREAPTTERRGFVLLWDAPAECADRSDLLAEVQKLVSTDQMDAEVHVRGRVKRNVGHYQLELIVQDGALEERRRFGSSSCSDLMGAATIAIALLLQSKAAHDSPEPTDDRGAGPSSGSSDPPGLSGTRRARGEGASGDTRTQEDSLRISPKDESETTGGQRDLKTVLVVPALAFDFGVIPAASWAVAAGLGMQTAALRATLIAEWRPQVDVRSAGNAALGAHIDRGRAGLEGCREWQLDWLRISPCATAGLEYLHAVGFGEGVVSQASDVFWLAAGAGLGLRYSLSPTLTFALFAGAELETSRPIVRLEGIDEALAQVSPLNFRSRGGLEWNF